MQDSLKCNNSKECNIGVNVFCVLTVIEYGYLGAISLPILVAPYGSVFKCMRLALHELSHFIIVNNPSSVYVMSL